MARRLRLILGFVASITAFGALPAVASARMAGTFLDPGYKLALLATDVITLKDGTVLVGEILREGEEGLVFKDKDGKTRLIKYDEVDNIETTRPKDETKPKDDPPPPPPPPRARPNPEVEVRRTQLLQRRQTLLTQRSRIRVVSPIVTTLSGLVIMGVAAVAFTGVEQTAYLLVGGIVVVLGAGGFCFGVARRSRLDREINSIDRQLAQLNAMGWHVPGETLPTVTSVELTFRF